MLVLDSSDNFWNEERIKKSRKSLLCDLNDMVKSRSWNIKRLFAPTLLEKWETKKERIKKIKLLDMVVELYDRKW